MRLASQPPQHGSCLCSGAYQLFQGCQGVVFRGTRKPIPILIHTHLQRLQASRFHVSMKDVGPIASLKVELDGNKQQEAWRCQMITLEHAATGATTYFACDK